MNRGHLVRAALGIYAVGVFVRGVNELTSGESVAAWVSLLIGGGLLVVVVFRYDDSMEQLERTPYFQLIVGSVVLFVVGVALGIL
ncbi:hypothetical protein [Haloprofundus marisrubri]|nr:hypothetical protein [Haloprofundus marisrubri]